MKHDRRGFDDTEAQVIPLKLTASGTRLLCCRSPSRSRYLPLPTNPRRPIVAMEQTDPVVAVAEAADAARVVAVAAAEARCAAVVAEKEASAAVNFAAIAADKVQRVVEAVKASSHVEANSIVESLDHVDFKYHVSIKNSLRYAIQEMRRQSSLLHTINNLCCSIPEVDGGKVGKLAGHLDHVCKMLEKTSIVCEQDLENKCPSWDLYDPPSDVVDDTSGVEDLEDGYVSEDLELWEMVF